MELQHVNVKLLVKNPQEVDLEPLIPVFHGWIQDQVCEELLLDVADYRHVYAGPGVVLWRGVPMQRARVQARAVQEQTPANEFCGQLLPFLLLRSVRPTARVSHSPARPIRRQKQRGVGSR